MHEDISLALSAIKNGKPIIIFDSQDREAEGDIAFAAQYCTPELVNLCLSIGRGLICVSLPVPDANRFKIERLNTNSKDKFGTPFGMPVNLADDTSGISAAARSATIKTLADEDKNHSHLSYPGHVHTLIAHPEGLKGRIGHTEAIIDLLRHAKIKGPGVLCEVLNDDGTIASYEDLKKLGEVYNLPLINFSSLQAYITVNG